MGPSKTISNLVIPTISPIMSPAFIQRSNVTNQSLAEEIMRISCDVYEDIALQKNTSSEFIYNMNYCNEVSTELAVQLNAKNVETYTVKCLSQNLPFHAFNIVVNNADYFLVDATYQQYLNKFNNSLKVMMIYCYNKYIMPPFEVIEKQDLNGLVYQEDIVWRLLLNMGILIDVTGEHGIAGLEYKNDRHLFTSFLNTETNDNDNIFSIFSRNYESPFKKELNKWGVNHMAPIWEKGLIDFLLNKRILDL